jgi:DNA-binding NarL/FixJ family response regulator
MTDAKKTLELTRIVLAVNDELDAFLIGIELRKSEFPFSLRRVVCRAELVKVLTGCDPGLLILDYEMVNLEILRGLHDQWPLLPIIVVSASKDETLPERCIQAGASAFVQMSRLQLLPETIESHLARDNQLAGNF